MNKAQRFIKKVKIGLIPVLFILLIAIIVYQPKPDSCSNGIKDNGEEGIDCGGFCDNVCPLTQKEELAQSVIVNWAAFTEDGEDNYDLLVSVSNQNENWGASYLEYTFTIYDSNGKVITEIEENGYLMPGGTNSKQSDNKQYFAINDIKLVQKPEKVTAKLSEYVWEEITDSNELTHVKNGVIETYNESYWFDEQRDFYIGRAETMNNSKYSFKLVNIVAVLFNEEDEVISIAKTDQRTMENGNGWGFEVFWPNLDLDEDQKAFIDTGAYTNVFDKYNYIKDYISE